MRLALLYNPRLLCERLAIESVRRRRLARLKDTPASGLSLGHIDSLELLELLAAADIRVIYDIGANVGTWTLLANAVMPHATIHAFEPLSDHCNRFASNTRAVSNVTLHRVALGAEEKAARLHVMDFSDASSVLPLAEIGQSTFGTREIDQRTVQVRALDRYRREHQLPFPDLMKLDVQGYEAEVLRGAVECVAKATAIITEVSFAAFYRDQPLFADIVRMLDDHGFRLHALSAHTPLGQPLCQTDALFVKKATVSAWGP